MVKGRGLCGPSAGNVNKERGKRQLREGRDIQRREREHTKPTSLMAAHRRLYTHIYREMSEGS